MPDFPRTSIQLRSGCFLVLLFNLFLVCYQSVSSTREGSRGPLHSFSSLLSYQRQKNLQLAYSVSPTLMIFFDFVMPPHGSESSWCPWLVTTIQVRRRMLLRPVFVLDRALS